MARAYQKRMLWAAASLVVLALIAFFVVQALRDNLVFFYTTTQVADGTAAGQKHLRIGGMVQAGSLKRSTNGVDISFNLSDGQTTIPVIYQGSLPDLFKEGKGAVADGSWDGKLFHATTILAKHDENYMPPGMEGAMPKGANQEPQSMPSLQQ